MEANILWQKADPCLGMEGGVMRRGYKEAQGNFWRRVMNMFIILIMVLISWAYAHVKTYHAVYFKSVQFVVCQLYLNKDVK